MPFLSFQFKPGPLVLLCQIILYFSSVSLSQLLRLQGFRLTWARTTLVPHQRVLQILYSVKILYSVQSIVHIQRVFVEWISKWNPTVESSIWNCCLLHILKELRHMEQQDFVLHSPYLVIFRIMVSKNNHTCSQIRMEYGIILVLFGIILVLFRIRKAFVIIWDG